MIYLDYSATTPVDRRVLNQFVIDNERFFGNPNSVHKLGHEASREIIKAGADIKRIIGLDDYEIVYTSGASESNNLAIKGVAFKKQMIGKHIITSKFEHASVVSCLSYLSKLGFKVDVVENDEFGRVDLLDLESLITEETILVTIGAVNSETGIVQNLSGIKTVCDNYPNLVFHSDMTQAIGKINMDYRLADLISFSAHKFYGLKGIGGLLVREGIKLVPLIHGGKSTTLVRAGTPATPLILSLRNALKYMYEDFDEKLLVVKEMHDYFIKKLKNIENAVLNSNDYSLNQIINVSFLDNLSGFLHQEMSERDICISTSTACGSENPVSMIVKKLTGSFERAETSVRISISHLTTKNEIDAFFKAYMEINAL